MFTNIPTDPESVASHVQIGDVVEVKTKDGQEQTFIVLEMDQEGLAGEEQRIEYHDIKRLKKQRLNRGQTAGSITGAASLSFLLLTVL
jgi:hypothetical protein